MRQEAAALQLWLAHEEFHRERRELQAAERSPQGSDTRPIRRRLGRAMIALGQRLAGDPRDAREAPARRRLAARPS